MDAEEEEPKESIFDFKLRCTVQPTDGSQSFSVADNDSAAAAAAAAAAAETKQLSEFLWSQGTNFEQP